MVMDRRGFLGSMLALGAAPAIVRAESLMKIFVPSQELIVQELITRSGMTLLTPAMIVKEALQVLESNLAMAHLENRKHNYPFITVGGLKIARPKRFGLV